jgi:hypothetical protein
MRMVVRRNRLGRRLPGSAGRAWLFPKSGLFRFVSVTWPRCGRDPRRMRLLPGFLAVGLPQRQEQLVCLPGRPWSRLRPRLGQRAAFRTMRQHPQCIDEHVHLALKPLQPALDHGHCRLI